MAFAKAHPRQGFLKVSLYGPPGSGKTFTSLLFAEHLAKASGKRIAYIDTEQAGGGTDFYAKGRPKAEVHADPFDFDALYTLSLAEALLNVRELDTDKYGVVVVDSISALWDAAIEAYEGDRVGKDGEKIPFHAWASIKRPYKELISRLMAAPAHVLICGRQKNVFEDSGGELKKVGVAMKAEGETQYEPAICMRMQMLPDGTITAFAEKDRTGMLAGRTIAYPDGKTLDPILALLGKEHVQYEDDEERLAADKELLLAEQDKAKKKEGKSTNLFRDLQQQIAHASNLSAIGAVASEIKKQRRYLLQEHLDALRAVYEQKRDDLMSEQAGDV